MDTATLTLTKETVKNLQQTADNLGISSTNLAEKAIRQYLRREAAKKVRQEEIFYREQHERLLETHRGKYIALHNGQVIDQGDEELTLYLRIREKHPSLGILIKKVVPEVDEVWQLRSPRMEYH
ncbi:MAG: hypothetical protein GY803_00780 [Chloroflexi bacterium]|nr:hypothetical protein [Chloroflexota bacterium]